MEKREIYQRSSGNCLTGTSRGEPDLRQWLKPFVCRAKFGTAEDAAEKVGEADPSHTKVRSA